MGDWLALSTKTLNAMAYKVINKTGGISGVFRKRKEASEYAKSKGFTYQWFLSFEPLDDLIAAFKNIFSK